MSAIGPSTNAFGVSKPFSDARLKCCETLKTLFPPLGGESSVISALLVGTSSGAKTLFLAGDPLFFGDLRNSYDPLNDVMPVVFDCSQRFCSESLFRAIQACGHQVKGFPPIVAFEIEDSFFNNQHPQEALTRLIEEGEETYGVKKIPDKWTVNKYKQNKGLSFEQTSGNIKIWVHGPNHTALPNATKEAQRVLVRAKNELTKAQKKIITAVTQGKYWGGHKINLDRQHQEKRQTEEKARQTCDCVTKETVNSADQPTLQCRVTMQVNDQGQKENLARNAAKEVADFVANKLNAESWEDLNMDRKAIEGLIAQTLKDLEEKVFVLKNNSFNTCRNWRDFEFRVFPIKKKWLNETFDTFSRSGQQPDLEKAWQKSLGKKLKWVTAQWREACRDYQILGYCELTEHMKLCDQHAVVRSKILIRNNLAKGLTGVELTKKRVFQKKVQSAVINAESMRVSKRITRNGKVISRVLTSEDGASDRMDNENEVHVPVRVYRLDSHLT